MQKDTIRVRDRLAMMVSLVHVVLVLVVIIAPIIMGILDKQLPGYFEKLTWAIVGDFLGYSSGVATFYFGKST